MIERDCMRFILKTRAEQKEGARHLVSPTFLATNIGLVETGRMRARQTVKAKTHKKNPGKE